MICLCCYDLSCYDLNDARQGPIATVAVVGPYHSGKSFMLNNLAGAVTGSGLQTSSSGAAFQVGQSVDPATRGIWAHHVGRVELGDDRGEADLVLLDTEVRHTSSQ